jgi:RNA polymerase sigma-70 factor (ECF subfamily)
MSEDELATLFRSYGYVVFRRCIVYLGEPSAAQDAVQEVFVRALRAAPGVHGDSDPRTWLCRLADQFCVDVLHSGSSNPVGVEPSRADAVETLIEAAVGDDDLDSLLMVRRLLDGLDAESVQLAVLYYVDELTQEELARELGVSRRTISKRLEHLSAHARGPLRQENAS